MIGGMEHLPSTEAAVTALRALAGVHGREMVVTQDIGAERTSRRTAAGVGVTVDPDGSLPHEAHVGFGGLPRVRVRLYPTTTR
ncbi:conserved hypothetical protein [Streptomyces griseoflavus Tu4000]|uniref:Uncharacterized protein n=1 Tax=Streptomyces griseoflavus Tu4000 TaxID=467200 RepID=D9XPY4_9ACTN|nr:conserved hypothetical protein [Streptomyces griseoflavus Tu4000]